MEIDDDKMLKLIKASGNNVNSFWCKLFSNALRGHNVNDLIMNCGASGSTGAVNNNAGDNN
jgi:ribosomal protein L12E/L44/L45/RPP1/RPP2